MENIKQNLDKRSEIFRYFHRPEHVVELQMASERTKYAWKHMSEYFPTSQVSRRGGISNIPEHLDSAIGNLEVSFSNGESMKVDEYFDSSTMDAIVVVDQGRIVYERYKTMKEDQIHNWFSCSKSIVGTLVAIMEHKGHIDVKHSVSKYLPELKGSEWDNVTVEETLDMATGLDSTEHEEADARTNPERGWYKWAVSLGVFENKSGSTETPIQVLRGMKRVKPGHTVFEYNSINTYVLQRILETLSGSTLSDLVSEHLWGPIGAEHDAYYCLDEEGDALGWGFMNTTLRDLARFGMAFTPSFAQLSDKEIIPEDVIKKFVSGLRPQMYSKGAVGGDFQKDFLVDGLANRYQWDLVTPDGDIFKAGVGGQGLYISPPHDCVVAFFSTGTADDERKGAWLARSIINRHKVQ